ncbi:hypothetical protein [Halobacterium salinarum]|uniref:hypothetical protein n=1 Tax=Halobacterium salinarum TaxID=2242 RepID=UPI002556EBE8|nr:hypothetical protein [Halobacterium salinarum]MDL0127086.1 hypothetical protein [Halobacterium salinarum]
MGDRKHISATQDAFQDADAVRGEDESWSEFLHRAAEALDGSVETDPETDLGDVMARLDDLEATIPSRTADDVENRLRTR